MQFFTYDQVIHLNMYLEDQGLYYKAHFKNEQALVMEPLGKCACEGKDGLMQQAVKAFYDAFEIQIYFGTDGVSVHPGKRVEVVAAVIKDKSGKVFATQRGYGEFKDFWEFPGGKIEPGETQTQALVREIKEELDSEIEVREFIYTVEYDYPTFHLTMHTYECALISGKLELLEHEDAKWLEMDELDSVVWLPADVVVVDYMRG